MDYLDSWTVIFWAFIAAVGLNYGCWCYCLILWIRPIDLKTTESIDLLTIAIGQSFNAHLNYWDYYCLYWQILSSSFNFASSGDSTLPPNWSNCYYWSIWTNDCLCLASWYHYGRHVRQQYYEIQYCPKAQLQRHPYWTKRPSLLTNWSLH